MAPLLRDARVTLTRSKNGRTTDDITLGT